MTRTIRLSAAALAVALVPIAGIGMAAGTAHAAENGFSTVADLPFAATAAVSATPGSVYVAGVDTDGTVHLQLRTATTATDITVPKVTIPDGSAWVPTPRLVTRDGAAYLYVGGALYEVRGTTATAMPVPSGDIDGAPFEPGGIAADASGLYITGSHWITATPVSGPAVARWNGTSWTLRSDSTPATYHNGVQSLAGAFGGIPVGTYMHRSNTTYTTTYSDTGSAFVSGPYASSSRYGAGQIMTSMTGTTGTGYTLWGYHYDDGTFLGPKVLPTGACADGDAATGHPAPGTPGCVAPTWPVSSATRLADGRVILGGSNATILGMAPAAPAGFAVVDTPGATPKDVNGTVGDAVVALAAEPSGSTVWALTRTGTKTTLQEAALTGETAPTTEPTTTPTSTPTPTTTPTNTPTPTTTPTAKPTKKPCPPKPKKPKRTARPTHPAHSHGH